MLDRFDGYPDLDDIPPPRPERDAMEEAKREMEFRLCGHMENDFDPHDPTKDKEETR